MNTIDILKAARELLSDPAHWTQGWYAKDARGEDVIYNGGKAVCWCMQGALAYVTCTETQGADWSGALTALAELTKHVPDGERDLLRHHAIAYNDAVGRKHEEILSWFDKTIAAMETPTP